MQLGLQARVVFAPEVGEVLGDLDRAHAGGEDLDGDRDTAKGDAGGAGDVVEFLDAQGDEGGGVGGVGHSGATTVG